MITATAITAPSSTTVETAPIDSGSRDSAGTGTETLFFPFPSLTIFGTSGNDMLTGSFGDDYLYGLAGNDTLDGGRGADVMAGGTGDDTYIVDNAGDVVWEWAGEGTDRVIAFIDYTLPTGVENLVLRNQADVGIGNGLDNRIQGLSNHDTLSGLAGNDILVGHHGNDVLIGGIGRDFLVGGNGAKPSTHDADRFVWASLDETSVSIPDMDVIDDFTAAQGDLIDLSSVDADVFAAGNQAFTFIGQAGFSGTPGEINFIHVDGKTIIQMQTGTSADIEGGIVLQGLHTPEASWFLL
jgi:Ca2+-binding RTX toxin-like protein